MNFIVDICLCLIVILGGFLGYLLGFVRMAAKPVKFILNFVIAFALCGVVADVIIAPLIGTPVTKYITDFMYENCGNLTAETAAQELPTVLKAVAWIFNIDVAEVAANAEGEIIESLIAELTAPAVHGISVVIAFLALLILSKLVLGLVFMLVNRLFTKGVFGVVNKILGCVFSIVFSVLIAWGVAVLTEMVLHIPSIAENEIVASFEGGYIYSFFNSHNPIDMLLSF